MGNFLLVASTNRLPTGFQALSNYRADRLPTASNSGANRLLPTPHTSLSVRGGSLGLALRTKQAPAQASPPLPAVAPPDPGKRTSGRSTQKDDRQARRFNGPSAAAIARH